MSEKTNEQIDAEIAEKVMGWKRRLKTEVYGYDRDPKNSDDDWLEGFDNKWWTQDDKDTEQCVEDEGSCREDYQSGFSPSSSWSAAAMVVEEMKGKGWNVSMTYQHITKQWSVLFWRPQTGVTGIRYNGPFIERAICGSALAALAAERGGK